MQVKYVKRNVTIFSFFIFVLYIACIGFGKLGLPFQTTDAEIPRAAFSSPAVSTLPVEKKMQEKNDIPKAHETLQQYGKLLGNPAEAAEVRAWFAKRGKFISIDSDAEYLSYNQETLEKLAASGDIRAMQMLAEMYLDQNHFERYGFNAAKEQYWKAAAYGSTESLINLAVIEKNTVYGLAKNDTDKKSGAMEVLAIYKAAELRGDLWSTANQVPVFKEMEHITISEIEQLAINQRAQQIYAELQQKRELLGLGDFDNSMPESVKQFFDRIKTSK